MTYARIRLIAILVAALAWIGAPAHAQQVTDPDDSPGRLDIASVTDSFDLPDHGPAGVLPRLTLRMTTHDRWGARILRSNTIELQLRRRSADDPKLFVVIRHIRGRLSATLSTSHRILGDVNMRRANGRMVVVQMSRARLFGGHVSAVEYGWVTRYNSGRAGDDQCGTPSDVAIICLDETDRWIRLSR